MGSNQNLPPLQVYVHHSNLYEKGHTSEAGTLVSVRAQSNQALQFSVLLESGALYTGLPINALSSFPDKPQLNLSIAQAYDCISSDIHVLTLDLLRHMKCTYLPFGSKIPQAAYYLFTIDFIESGLARHPTQWKQFHILKSAYSGNWVAYPQYRIQFKDGALCPDSKTKLPNYKYHKDIYTSENF